ncbi:hypothetical protein H0H81_010364 [Sphagnurus paluster]|uniref:Uncharacterized protein n=1 Tax=Sphagnurus paluster TaxID=117069 RepID=A0A9P7FP51_9AGAR|nr:hypothetical protein H0H81_010364 [Sphagnurus paluster]
MTFLSATWRTINRNIANLTCTLENEALTSTAESSGSPADGHYWYFPADVKQAVLDQDINKIDAAKKKHAADLEANIKIMSKKGPDAYVTTTNESNKQQYQICETETGIMWTYTTKIEHVKAKVRATVAVGSFSKNAQILGISTTTLTNLPTQIADLTISSIAAKVVGTFVAQRLGGAIYAAALAAAETAATAGLEAAGIMVSELVVTIASFVTGLIALVVVGIIVYYVVSVLHKSFGLTFNVYNWSTSDEWDIVEWYSDNALMQDVEKKEGPFKPAKLPAVSSTFNSSLQSNLTDILLPFRFGYTAGQVYYRHQEISFLSSVMVSDDSVAAYATYTALNDNNWAEGLGMGLKAVSKSEPAKGQSKYQLFPRILINGPNTVLYMKYVVHWGKDNELNLADNSYWSSLESFYKGSWAGKGTGTISLNIAGTPVVGMTPALRGESSHLYSFDIHIGATAQ